MAVFGSTKKPTVSEGDSNPKELTGTTLEKAEILGITDWSISVSDEQQHAVAFVIAEGRDISASLEHLSRE